MIKHPKITFNSLKEMPYTVISQGTTEFNRTGTWRYLKPVYKEKLPPCQSACPAGNNLALILRKVREGAPEKAWEAFMETSPFPHVCGNVCPHPCEDSCSRSKFDEAISIKNIEGFLGEEAVRNRWVPRQASITKAEKVAVIGSGPAGLSCAYQLARRGYPVTVFEAAGKAGGLLRWGIPEYRLEKKILDTEIARIQELGVEIRTNSLIKDLPALLGQGYSALFVAIGAGISQAIGIPDEKTTGISYALDFLRDVNSGAKVNPGRRVVVIGGGNAAIDAARVSHNLGAGQVTVVYRRSRNEMPALKSEVDDAEREGVKFIFLAGPQKIMTDKGLVKGLGCIRMTLGKTDASGRQSPVQIDGSEFSVDADSIIVAIGQTLDKSNLPGRLGLNGHGTIPADPVTFQTSVPGIFAGGDAVTGPSTVAGAIGSGRLAALSIDTYLGGCPPAAIDKPLKVARFEDLNLNYFDHAARQSQIQGLASAATEANRCFSCGVCRGCDNCLVFCPDMAVHRNNGAYDLNYDYCKGCGICSQECPCSYISMTEEER
jgi:heterodisulfide reductase subunit A2